MKAFLFGFLACLSLPLFSAPPSPYLYDDYYWGFNEKAEEQITFSKSQILEMIDDFAKPSKELQIPESVCGEKSVFAKETHWSCDKQGWQNHYQMYWNHVVKAWKKNRDLLKGCAFKGETQAQTEFDLAKKESDLHLLLKVARRYPFTVAGMNALVFAARFNLELGEFSVASLLFDTAFDRANALPELFPNTVNAKFLIEAAFAGKRSGLKTSEEISKLLSQAKEKLGTKSLTFGYKTYAFSEIEEEIKRQLPKTIAEMPWKNRPYSFIFPEELRFLENARAKEENSKKDSAEIVHRVNRETELFQDLLTLNPENVRLWIEASLEKIQPHHFQAQFQHPIGLYGYLAGAGLQCHITQLTSKPLWISVPRRDIPVLSSSLKNLRYLDLGYRMIDNFQLDFYTDRTSPLPKENAHTGDEKLTHLHLLQNLTILNLDRTRITDASFDSLRKIKTLKHLILRGTRITSSGFSRLKELPQLTHLDLALTRFGNAELAAIAPLKNLEYLNLAETNVTNEGLKSLKEFPSLNSLDLTFSRITDTGLAVLSQLPSLETLILDTTKISDEGIKEFSNFTKLETLDLISTKVTEKGLKNLRVPNLKKLILGKKLSEEIKNELVKKHPGLLLP